MSIFSEHGIVYDIEDIYCPQCDEYLGTKFNLDSIGEELLRWRNAVRKAIARNNNIPFSYVTDVMIENYLRNLEYTTNV